MDSGLLDVLTVAWWLAVKMAGSCVAALNLLREKAGFNDRGTREKQSLFQHPAATIFAVLICGDGGQFYSAGFVAMAGTRKMCILLTVQPVMCVV